MGKKQRKEMLDAKLDLDSDDGGSIASATENTGTLSAAPPPPPAKTKGYKKSDKQTGK